MTDKKTFIRNAQKQVQKGQLDRAIASYKAILKIDARDEKVHNALGDLYIRKNMKNEAIKEYLWVADYYEKDGFHLRSIAICQKILNLAPDLAEVRLKLADLYTQQRLAAEAKAQYLQVADYYDKKGKVERALEVFGKIADLDPDNLKVRVRLGAMYEKQSLPGKAAGEYARAAEGHLKKKETEKAVDLIGRALQLSPTHLGARLVLAELHAAREEWEKIVEALEPLVSAEGADTQVLKTFAGACLRTGRASEAIGALEKARELEPSSLPVKTLLGRAYLQGGQFEKAFDIYGPMISEDLKENRQAAAEDLARELVQASPGNDKAQQRLLEVLQKGGKTEEIPGVYMKLAEIYQARGLIKNAAGALEKYLELTPEDVEAAARLSGLASGQAPPPAPVAEEAPPASVPPPSLEEMDVEMIDIAGEDLAEMAPFVQEKAGKPAAEPLPGEGIVLEEDDEEEELVLDFEDEMPLEEVAAAQPSPEPEPAGESAAPPPEQLPEAEVPEVAGPEPPVESGQAALDDASFLALDSEAQASGTAVEEETVAEPSGEEAPVFPILGEQAAGEIDLEEVDLEEELAAPAPEAQPVAEEPLPDTGVDAAAGEVGAAQPGPQAAEAPPAGEDLDFDLNALQEEEPLPSAPVAEKQEDAGAAEEIEEFLAEADFYFQQGLLDEAEFLYQKLSKLAPDNPEIAERLARFEEEKAAAAAPGAAAEPLTDNGISSLEGDLDRALRDEARKTGTGMKITIGEGGAESPTGEFSDFLSDLREELEESVAAPEPAATDDEGLSGIFQEFREGLKEQLGEEDFETHYNLGIAYKEMGLLEEALGEFELSEKSESRKLDSLSMIALCLKDMGRNDEAVVKLQEGLHLATEGSDEQKGFLYDLAGLYDTIGHQGESLELFRRLYEIDPGYRDVGKRTGRPASSDLSAGSDKESEPAKRKKPRVSYL